MNTIRLSQRGAAQTTMIVGAVIAVLFVYFLFRLITSGVQISPDDATESAVNGRIHPSGVVTVAAPAETPAETPAEAPAEPAAAETPAEQTAEQAATETPAETPAEAPAAETPAEQPAQ
ncbi:MAG: hypothetical protein IJ143_01310 [Neisseriaceae bacterium]|nr:hypothetical protein [Neisseriaceae bacterium]